MDRSANLFRALEVEWGPLAGSDNAGGRFRSWAETHAELARFAGPVELVVACHERSDPAGANRLVGALLGEAGGDALAARVILQIVTPGLAGISRRCWRAVGAGRTWADLAELDQDVVATAYDQIVRLSAARPLPSWPITAVVDATWRRIRTAIDHHQRRTMTFVPLPDGELVNEASCRPDDELFDVLADALRAGVVSEEAARLVVRTRLLGFSPAEEAAALGSTVAWVYKQRERAERALAAAASATLRNAS